MAEFKDTTNLKGIKEGDIVNVADLKYRYTPEGTFVLENAASPLAPTSTPTPTTNINARPIRYPTEGAITPVLPQTDIEKAQSELYGAPEERKLLDEAGKSKIRANVREQFQTYLDAVNASYNRLLSEEKQRGVGRLGRTRAGAAAGGILGGSFGEQALGETERYNVELEKGVEEGRQLKLAEFFTKIDERALKEIEAQQAERKGKAEAYINFLTTSKTDTQRDIKTLASSGIKISDIPENRYKQLLNQSGMDPLQFESFYYSNLPDNLKPITKDIETRLPNGNAGMIRIETDPKTGKSTQRTFDYGVKNEQLYGKYPGGIIKENGIIYGIGPDGTLTPLTKKQNELKDLPTSYQEWSLAGKPDTYANFLKKKKDAGGAEFKPSTDERSAVNRYISKYGSEEDIKKVETDSGFFYSILEKAVGTEEFNIQPFKYPFGY